MLQVDRDQTLVPAAHQPADQPLCALVQIGMAVEPGRQAHQAVTASLDGNIHLSDLRAVGGSAGAQDSPPRGVWRSLRVDPKGRLSCLAVHHTAPLIAAGSTTVSALCCAGRRCMTHRDRGDWGQSGAGLWAGGQWSHMITCSPA